MTSAAEAVDLHAPDTDCRTAESRSSVLNCPRTAPLTGRVHGTTIDLDVAPNPPLEGKRVRVVLELVDDDVRLTPEEQARAWSTWLRSGPDGPIPDDGDPEFP